MCVPLKYKGKLLGLIYLGNDNIANLFDVRTLEVLTVFASQASLMIQNALLIDELRLDRDQLLKEIKHIRFGEMIGSCPSMLEVFNMVRKVAPSDVSVLITGETGTGKELIARQIHRLSSRAKGPFVALNCGAIPENLIESELFGHERGAFTGAVTTKLGKFHLANHGTIFLDEIGELSPALQVKLLRVLQEKAVMKVGSTKSEYLDIRVIAATNKDLKQEIKKGRFREDLFWRLNVITISLPPLRDRGDDVIVIAKYLLEKYAKEYNKKTKGFTKEAISAIKKFHWPGNIRELENRIKKAIILGEKNFIEAEDLELPSEDSSPLLPLHQAKEAFQRRYILEALRRNQGNRTKTAMDLGVDPRTIFRYLEKVPNEK
jgi:transcriptional regulator with PAS, ATPase and Fis domain